MGSLIQKRIIMEELKKKASESEVIMTEMVLPNDTNTLNHMMGGRLLHLMDIAAAVAAQRHSNKVVVTASVDNVSFREPIELGNVITLKAKVTRSFNSSMEVYIIVTTEDIPSKKKTISNSSFYTFVAVDEQGNPSGVPELIPETKKEKEMYHNALMRRQLRLVLANRMKPEDATEIKSIFVNS